MAMWKNDDEMFALMKEKLYTPVVGDILDQMGYKHQFLPASIRPLAAQVPTAPYILPGEEEDKRLKVAGYACTVLENDVFEYPAEKPFGYMTEALDDLKPNEIYIATGAHNSALWGELLTACGKAVSSSPHRALLCGASCSPPAARLAVQLAPFWTATPAIPPRSSSRTSLFSAPVHGHRIPPSVPTCSSGAAPLRSVR